MRFLSLILLIFVTTHIYGQSSSKTIQLHENFKKHIFKNADSSLYYIHLLKEKKHITPNYLASYYYHQNLGQYHLVRGRMDSSEYHYKKASVIISASNIDTLLIQSKIWLANHQYFKGNMDSMKLMYTDILHESEKANYLEGITTAYSMFAGLEADLSKKMNLYLKIDSLYQANHTESSLLARVYVSIADLYIESHSNYEFARSYLKKSSEISHRVHYPPGLHEVNRILIKIAILEEDYDTAIDLHRQLLEHGITHDDPTSKDVSMLGISQMFLKKNDLQNALIHLKKSEYLLELPEGSPLLGRAHLLWTELYLMQKNFNKAFYHLLMAKDNPDLSDEEGFRMEVLTIEINYYESIEHFEKAYLLKNEFDLNSTIQTHQRNTDRFILDEQLRIKAQNEQELALIKTQNELAVQRQKGQRNLLFGGIGLTSIAGLFLFVLYRNKQQTNKKLRSIDTLKNNFFTYISHEFRTPLTVINTPIEETLENPSLSSEKRIYFELAKKNINRLESLVYQILELSKIDSGSRVLLLEKNKPTLMIAVWSESFSYLAQQKNIDFKTSLNDKEIEAWFDQDALENIVVNLLGNAIKYTPHKGFINLFSSIDGNRLKIKVKNSGEGLTNAEMKTLFTRFYQTNRQNEGSGIGLSLVKELIELHGGQISVNSQEGAWTSFEAELSLDKRRFKQAKIKTISEPIPKTLGHLQNVPIHPDEEFITENNLPIALLVEDNPDVRILLSQIFKKEYQIVLAYDGQDGISKALEVIPDIIVSDVMMPIKDGIELSKTLKADEKTSHIPIVLLTAKVGDENELIGIETGADDYMTKPFNKKLLQSKVRTLVAQRKKLQQHYSQNLDWKPKDIAQSSVDTLFLEKVQKVLNDRLTTSMFSIEEFSKSVHMSRMQLHRKLKALTGQSASEFIRTERLKLAAAMLKQSNQNISEVSYQVGFKDHAYFSKCFKEAYQCSPTEYSSSNQC